GYPTIVNITSDISASCLGLSHHFAPSVSNVLAFDFVLVFIVTVKPLLIKLRTILSPITPIPIKPILVLVSIIIVSFLLCSKEKTFTATSKYYFPSIFNSIKLLSGSVQNTWTKPLFVPLFSKYGTLFSRKHVIAAS